MGTKGNPTSICHMNTNTYGSKVNLKLLRENVLILRFGTARSEKQLIFHQSPDTTFHFYNLNSGYCCFISHADIYINKSGTRQADSECK